MLTEALGLERARRVALCGAGGKTTLMLALAREWAHAGERVLVTTTTRIARAETEGEWPAVAARDAEELMICARRIASQRGGRGCALVAHSGAGAGEKLAGFAPGVIDTLKATAYFDRILVEADGSARKPLKAPAAHEPVVPAASDAVIVVAGLNGLGRPLDAEAVFRPEIWARLAGDAPGSEVTAEALAAVALDPAGLVKGCPPGVWCVLFLNRADTPERRAAVARIAERMVAARARTVKRVVAGCLLPSPEIAYVAALP